MSVTGISNISSYERVSNGNKINSASDNASGLAISEKLESQSKALSQSSDNASSGKDLLNVADNSLSNINDSLQRIYELSLKASNGTNSSDDLSAIQDEISQMKSGIQDAAKNTQFNQLNLLDGSMADIHLATDPSGGGLKIELYNSTLEALGIADYNVTSTFDITDIEDALKQVSSARSSIGAQSNVLDSITSYNNSAAFNNDSALSTIKDADLYEEITQKKQDDIMQQYKIFTQKAQVDQESSFNKVIGLDPNN
ncbi:MAG: flagellin [Lachnotalea sp.]